MLRCQEHRRHARIGDGGGKLRAQLEAVRFGETAELFGLFADAAREAQALALALHRFDYPLAPASEADNGGVDHCRGLGLAGQTKYVMTHCRQPGARSAIIQANERNAPWFSLPTATSGQGKCSAGRACTCSTSWARRARRSFASSSTSKVFSGSRIRSICRSTRTCSRGSS